MGYDKPHSVPSHLVPPVDRRVFLRSLAGLTAATVLPLQTSADTTAKSDRLGPWLPTRWLGRTQQAVTMLGVGGWHLGRMSEREAQATIEAALEGGIRFFDSAESYQSGGSESRLGQLLTPKYRDLVYVMTKTTARTGQEAKRHLEDSLRRLATDRLDLWQVHALTSAQDVDDRIRNGVLDVVVEAKKSGKVRHIGFTGHTRPAAHRQMLEKTDLFDTCQMPINLADPSYESFIGQVLPQLVQRNIGVLAMKTLANGGFFGGSTHGEHGSNPRLIPDRVSMAEAIHFVWSLPVTVLITGSDNAQQLKEKMALARSFVQIDEKKRQALMAKVSDLAGKRLEFYKA